MNGGTTAYASPWIGTLGVFPVYRSRNAKVNALQDRINDCFQPSMDGKSLPVDGDEMHAILSYMWRLSKDVPTGMDLDGRGLKRIKLPDPAAIDPVRGAQLYAERRGACHGVDGQGLNGADGANLFPALSGPKSFRILRKRATTGQRATSAPMRGTESDHYRKSLQRQAGMRGVMAVCRAGS